MPRVSVQTRQVLTPDGVRLHVQVEQLHVEPPSRRWPWSRRTTRPGLTVVFCHGYGLSRLSWRYQRQAMRRLPGVLRLVYYDHRGHGRSQAGELARCTIDQLGADLAAVVEQVCSPQEPVVLVGHSMGGMAIMALVGQRPHWLVGQGAQAPRVRAVALLTTSAGGLASVDPLGVPPLLARLMRRTVPPVVALMGRVPTLAGFGLRGSPGPAAWRTSRRLRAEWDLALTRRSSYVGQVPRELVAWTSQMINHTPVEVWCAFFPTFHDHDKLAALEHMRSVPVLLLGAEKDVVTPITHTLDMAGVLPHARLVRVPDAGHMVMAQQPGVVNAELAALVGRIVEGQAQ